MKTLFENIKELYGFFYYFRLELIQAFAIAITGTGILLLTGCAYVAPYERYTNLEDFGGGKYVYTESESTLNSWDTQDSDNGVEHGGGVEWGRFTRLNAALPGKTFSVISRTIEDGRTPTEQFFRYYVLVE